MELHGGFRGNEVCDEERGEKLRVTVSVANREKGWGGNYENEMKVWGHNYGGEEIEKMETYRRMGSL